MWGRQTQVTVWVNISSLTFWSGITHSQVVLQAVLKTGTAKLEMEIYHVKTVIHIVYNNELYYNYIMYRTVLYITNLKLCLSKF